ncbi:MAG: glycoside hydrolase family 2 [Prevotella sp.]|nr:glycoside hydrolase family 2 [Prevotella sp.]
MIKRTFLFVAILCAMTHVAIAQSDVSVAGLFPIDDQGREVWNFNPDWLFHLGDAEGAEAIVFDDSDWETVSVPHGVKLEPAEASGCRNYQGVAWYRKHFIVPADRSELYFEAIMGKQKIYVNGQLAAEHYGGYLPVIVSLREQGLQKGDECVVAVMTDNSNDKLYPPGKPQYTLDFAYHGGIYRDVWLIGKKDVSISDVITENRVAGGGIFVHYENISELRADVLIDTDLRNTSSHPRHVVVTQTLLDAQGKKVKEVSSKVSVPAGETAVARQKMVVSKPHLWSPETPYLYKVVTRIKEGKETLDGGMTKIGIRSFEFVDASSQQDKTPGFYLNGKRYRQFVGANRHQDFAYVGNAVPNSQQWRDVVRLKQAGFNIIRTAHYPQDPSFMDACDELGIFIIVATPGWQYWNKNDAIFEERVLQNTREIIRRDRNHPSVLMWEPILNETRYPLDFSLKSLQITKDEYPYPYRPVAAADMHSAGVSENYDVVYGWPGDDEKADKPKQCIFTREFGEYVDDWYAHNNLNRASRSWGEKPQLTQALSLAKTTEEMYRTTGQFIGGAQWHPFDHQRGYHPDPYWGGIYDAFRQPKTAFYMFASQNPATPLVHIAHEMTQFSDADVTVFSNCDSVRLSIYDGEKSWTLPVKGIKDSKLANSTPDFAAINANYHQPVIFKNVWDFWEARNYSYTQKNWQKVNMKAEGIIDGKVVCEDVRMPSRRSTKLRLRLDQPTQGIGTLTDKPLVADGSDFVVVICEVTDDSGHVRRLAKENIVFSVEGEGEIIGDASINANPRAVEWGSAPVLIRSTRKAGKIKIHAEVQFPGTHAPTPADLEIESVPYTGQFLLGTTNCGSRSEIQKKSGVSRVNVSELTDEQKAKLLQEVQDQQADFGIEK